MLAFSILIFFAVCCSRPADGMAMSGGPLNSRKRAGLSKGGPALRVEETMETDPHLLKVGESILRRQTGGNVKKRVLGNVTNMQETVATNPTVDEDLRVISMDGAHLSHSNLCGQGPDVGEENMRFENVTQTSDGLPIALIVTGADCGAFRSYKPERNGMLPPFGSINFACGARGTFTYRFEGPRSEEVFVKSMYASIVDLDESSIGTLERLTARGFSKYWMTASSELVMDIREDEVSWTSSTPGNGADNPRSVDNMSRQQLNRVVTLKYEGVSEISLNFAVLSRKACLQNEGGRNILWGFKTGLVEVTPPRTTTTTTPACLDLQFSRQKLAHNNLGGRGLDIDGYRGMYFNNIAELDGKNLTLGVFAEGSNYDPFNTAVNGVNGKMAQISGKCESEVDLSFELTSSLSGKPVVVPRLCFSFADLDEGFHGRCSESVTVDGFDAFYLADDTEITTSRAADGTTFKASEQGVGGPRNPKDPNQLDAEQSRRAVALEFTDVSKISAKFVWGRGGVNGRIIQFSGATAV